MSHSNHDKKDNYQEILSEMMKDLQYGSILLVIQDGKVIQIDKTEKKRL